MVIIRVTQRECIVFVQACQVFLFELAGIIQVARIKNTVFILQISQLQTVLQDIQIFIFAIYLVNTFYESKASVRLPFVNVRIVQHISSALNRVSQVDQEAACQITVIIAFMLTARIVSVCVTPFTVFHRIRTYNKQILRHTVCRTYHVISIQSGCFTVTDRFDLFSSHTQVTEALNNLRSIALVVSIFEQIFRTCSSSTEDIDTLTFFTQIHI